MTQDIFNKGLKFFNDLILKELNELTNDGVYIGGGSIRNWFTGIQQLKDYNDIDIWVKNTEALQIAMVYFESRGAKLTYDTRNAKMYYYNNKHYDLHHQFFCEPLEAMKFVDMTVNAGFCDGKQFFYPDDYFLHLTTKTIVWNCFNGYGIELLTQRLQKMILKGYSLSWKESKRIDFEMTKFLVNRNKEARRDAATA